MKDMITIIGFGSLLSEESARRTCPSLKNFRLGRVEHFVRAFNKVDSNCEDFADKNIASWAFVDMPGATSLVTLFEIHADDYPAFIRREADYDLRCISYIETETENVGEGIACCAFDDDLQYMEYLERHPIQKERYLSREFERYNGPIWRKDILPRNKYLAVCLEAARKLGKHYVENILRQGYLADEKTTLGEYISRHFNKHKHLSEMKWLKDFIKVSV